MRRMLALIIDAALSMSVLLAAIIILGRFSIITKKLVEYSDTHFNLVFGVAGQILFFLFAFLPSSVFGMTIGQKMMGVRLVTYNGHKISILRSILVYLSFVIVSMFLTFGIGILTIYFRRDRKGLHNVLTKTKVFEIGQA